jgi:hypothetical protein
LNRLLSWVDWEEECLKGVDLEAMEFGLRGQMFRLGASLLEALVNRTDRGYQGSSMASPDGRAARFVEYRIKRVKTVLGEIQMSRAYYYSKQEGRGFFPQDRIWDVEGNGYSPGMKRLVSRIGGQESFAQASEDLWELAELKVSPKEVERISEEVGEAILVAEAGLRQQVFAGKVETLALSPEQVGTAYIEVDGTGVPVVPGETVGRKGKGADGKARTREAKLGVVFTQTTLNEKGRPVRDEESATYVGGIETAEEVGKELYTEVERRGLSQAHKKIVLGDGAVWIWELAGEHFPEALQIVDLYHAREHLWSLGHALHPKDDKQRKRWVGHRIGQLDRGDIASLLKAFDSVPIPNQEAGATVRKEREYFNRNRDRMQYRKFKAQGLFLGSGVIEAGCKSVIGKRLKQSGMRWTVRGANAIIALRRCRLSHQWEDLWADRAASREAP